MKKRSKKNVNGHGFLAKEGITEYLVISNGRISIFCCKTLQQMEGCLPSTLIATVMAPPGGKTKPVCFLSRQSVKQISTRVTWIFMLEEKQNLNKVLKNHFCGNLKIGNLEFLEYENIFCLLACLQPKLSWISIQAEVGKFII